MLKADINNTSIRINQLTNQVENGEKVMIICDGKPIARLSAMSHTPRPLTSRQELRATQPQTLTSNLEIIQPTFRTLTVTIVDFTDF
jgi:antitoxin (DNA-binding transcriptional repressor) of toxin-antitoxin stability system